MIRYLAVFCIGALAVLAGELVMTGPSAPAFAPALPATPVVQAPLPAQVVRVVSPPARAVAPAAELPEPPPDPERAQRYAEAAARVDRALARGSWTAEDAAGFVDELAALTSDERMELLGQLVPALNDGTVALDGIVAPF